MALETTEQQTAELTDEQTCCGSSHCGSSRRSVLRAAGVGGAAAAIGLTAAACGSSSSGASTGSSNNNAAAGGGASSAAASAGSGAGSGGSVLATTSDIPVDGGKIVNADGGIVITQPASGTYKAFSAVCTHQGCTVGSVSDNQITCPCHGSVFSAKDGSVISGPAPAPLAAKNIKVSGTQITLA
ncbi:Rieske (2Fe-2S) protein [Actinocrinis sp.]|uniref:Rieske (2Fe-2S) protein n=1 Tax=Actinocrinis sp. TaxID=1920516 RepID=UPI002BE7EF96|nr:Rieske (2Fe-2S) protein [Actinocrinis sp.]HXR72994.1 Rieske (2Fe-2S) protein [Actinocrinis sp.]